MSTAYNPNPQIQLKFSCNQTASLESCKEIIFNISVPKNQDHKHTFGASILRIALYDFLPIKENFLSAFFKLYNR